MSEYIKYRYELYKLLSKRKNLKKSYDSDIHKAPEDSREREDRIAEATVVIGEVDLQIRELHTNYLQKIAIKLIVPIPNCNDESLWERQSMGYMRSTLTSKGIYELKKSIRLEKKERREVVLIWITLFIGLIGALIGLISVLKD